MEEIKTVAQLNKVGWIDMHCHLDQLEGGPDHAIQMAQQNGVERIITIGTEPEDLQIVLDLAQKYSPVVFCTIGIHPHEGVKYTKDIGDFLLNHGPRPEVVAIGEIGLDYYYDQSPRAEQIDAFEKQLEIAANLDLPVEIHTRDAEEDTIRILKNMNGRVKGLIHCFTGTEWLARQALDLGFNISISGVVTFKSADALRAVVKDIIPLDRLHVETDAPFLAPIPLRGKTNTSAYMIHTAKVVAGLKNISEEKLAEITKQNAKKLFKKLIWT
jgi:TatD DNase family protein